MAKIFKGHNGYLNVLAIIIPLVLMTGFFQLVTLAFLGIGFESDPDNIGDSQKAIVLFFGSIGGMLVIFLFRKYLDQKSIGSLGIKNEHVARDLLMGMLFGFTIVGAGYLILINTNQIQFEGLEFSGPRLSQGILLFAVVALSEEILFRGYVLSNLLNSFHPIIALIISAMLFSVVHSANPDFSWIPFFELLLVGILLGIPYLHNGNLWFPFGLHFSWNFFQGTIFGFNVSGKEIDSLMEISYQEANKWNGGDFGFEGSLYSLILSLVAIAVAIVLYDNSKKNG